MGRILLHGGQVLDVDSGVVESLDVVIEGDRIIDVGPGLDADTGIDLSGSTLVPGMIDAHAHMAWADLSDPTEVSPNFQLLKAVPTLRATLNLGVTTVRDAWGADSGLRDAIEARYIAGPRLQISLAQLCGTGGIGDHWSMCLGELTSILGSPWLPRGVFDGPAEARRAVRRMMRSGADVIKVAASGSVMQGTLAHVQQVADDELEAIVDEAARWRVAVMAHAHGARAAEAAARAGVTSIEHGCFLDEAAVAAMVDHGTWLVPTLLPSFRDDGDNDIAAAHERSFKLACDAGVRIAMGTDCPVVPHERRLEELGLMHRMGMPAAEVWRAATLAGATLLGRDDLGLVAPGRRADLVAIKGDVLDFDQLETRIEAVWKDGIPAAREDG